MMRSGSSVRPNQQGYVALLTVLIMGVASLAIATSLLFAGVSASQTAQAEQQSAQARNLASACAEEALQVLRDAPASGQMQGSRVIGGGSCEYTVSPGAGASRTIATTGKSGDVVKHTKLYVTIDTSSISVSSWQEGS